MAHRLVWIRENGHCSPQLWPHDGLGHIPAGSACVIAAQSVIRDDDFGLTLDELVAKYPLPVIPGEGA
jgi:hypothetical protein